jgi:hypothetical protein
MTRVPIVTGKVAIPSVTPSWDRMPTRRQVPLPDRDIPPRRSKAKRVKGLLGSAAGLMFIVLSILIPLAALYGLAVLTATLYPLVAGIAGIATLVLIFVLLPAALFKRNRHWCAIGVTFVSYVWWLALWMSAALLLYAIWGKFGFVLGLLLGIGSVVLACVASLIAGKFGLLALILFGTALVFGARHFGAWLASKGEL